MSGRERRLTSRLELRDAVVALGERHDVVDVGPAPLVDRLVVVADDDEVGCPVRLREQLDQPLLGRVDVLVLVDDQVPQLGGDLRVDRRVLERLDGADDLRAEGHEPVARRASRSTLERDC